MTFINFSDFLKQFVLKNKTIVYSMRFKRIGIVIKEQHNGTQKYEDTS